MVDISYYTSEALTLLHSLIGIPSISREEEAAADFLQNYIEENGIMRTFRKQHLVHQSHVRHQQAHHSP